MAVIKDPKAFRGRDRHALQHLRSALFRVVGMDERNVALIVKGHDKPVFGGVYDQTAVGDLIAATSAALSATVSDLEAQAMS